VSVETITVVGSGLMGRGIAYAAAVSGFRTILHDVSSDALDAALQQIRKDLDAGIARGKVPAETAKGALQRLSPEQELPAAAAESDFVIEAVSEDMALKCRLFARLDELCREDVVLATNTSALSVGEIAAATRRGGRVVGMHFFNPVPKMRLIEVVRALETTQATVDTTVAVGRRMGKETVVVKESPGFLTSRINALIGNEAFLMLEEGIASAEDIDKALKLGLNHPMGPFEMVDLVGLDTRLAVLEFLHERLGEKYRPAAKLVEHVRAGRLGRKVGRGVYEYPDAAGRKA
jgi:3-hydroxybutyryl-CoA dehydrogenase